MEIPYMFLLLILFGSVLIFLGAIFLVGVGVINEKIAIIICAFAVLSFVSILSTEQETNKVIKTEMCQLVESTINEDSLSQLLRNKDFTCVYRNQENEIISADLKDGEYKTFISVNENFIVKEKTIDNISTHKYLFLFDLICDLSERNEKEYEIYIPIKFIQ